MTLTLACAIQPLAGRAEPPALGSVEFAPSPDRPVGWRGDGNGRYPSADPPLNWSRTSKSVQGLRGQVRKPRPGDTGEPLSGGVIHQWLTLGPVPVPAEKVPQDKDAKDAGNARQSEESKGAKDKDRDDIGADIAMIEPDEGNRFGDLAWRPVKLDTSWLHLLPMYKAVAEPGRYVAYAHAWIHSAEGKPVFLDLTYSARSKIWLNGKDLTATKIYGPRKLLPLEKGWNRLLLRVAPLTDTGWSKGIIQWHLNAAFFGTERDEYESRNIVWSTPMPDNGPGAGSPILVGERLLAQAEAGVLVCMSARDGKVLWARSSTYADAASADERKKNSDAFAKIEPLAAQVADALKGYCDDPEKALAKPAHDRADAERKIDKLMVRMDPDRYAGQSGCEAGQAACTPASDGRHVYALFGSGLVTCFDLDGNRKWANVLDLRHNEHGYCASPCLVDGKLVIKASGHVGAVALDVRTGAVVTTMRLWKTAGLHAMSTPIVVPLGGERLIVQSFGVVTRAGDGKILAQRYTPPYYNIADYVSPVSEGPTICSYVLEKGEGRVRFAFQTLPEAPADPLVMKSAKEGEYDVKSFPTWFSYNHIASPLLHQGLAYVMSSDGVLTVIDAASAEVVYQKLLDVSPRLGHSGAAIRGGCAASPTLAGKHIYLWDNQGTTLVIEPGREFKQLARNRIERVHFHYGPERNEGTMSSPVFSGKRLYYRGEDRLYCIGPG
jgi:outer membrane protein assembly factor BamB